MLLLRVAERCGRLADADVFAGEIDADAFEELAAYDALEPRGWQADRIAIRRLGYLIAAAAGGKRLKERDFDVEIGGGQQSVAAQVARAEAYAIRSEIRERAGDPSPL